jgi:signal recognition particle receptor subunit beta
MAVFNYAKKEIDAKIVYYGPAISGKTTNLQFIHQHLKPDQRGKIVSLATNEDRTLFFDFLPIELESVRGFKTRIHLYTVPGQVYYGATRRAVLTGADGIVFVADSHADRLEDNLTSFKDLEDNLRYYGKKIDTVPLILQYNKRDLPNVLSVEELNQKFNRFNSPSFEAVATQGKGVFESLTMACRLVLKAIESGVESRRSPAVAEKTPVGPSKGVLPGKPSSSPEPPLPRPEPALAARPPVMEKAGAAPKGAQPISEIPRARAVPQERETLPSEPGQAGKSLYLKLEKSEEEKKPVSPSQPGKLVEKKKPDLSFKLEKGMEVKAPPAVEKKIPQAKGNARIVSCGQARVSSPGSLEIPLTLEVEAAQKSLSLCIHISVKLESFEVRHE